MDGAANNTGIRISIIVPVRNDAKNLEGCLASISRCAAHDDRVEIIVVNNGSTDGTQAVIDRYASSDGRIRSVFEPRVGRGSARHAGEAVTRGEVVLCTDSDCIVPEDWINTMADPILRGDADAVQGKERAAARGFWSDQQQARFEEKWSAGKDESSSLPRIPVHAAFVDTKNFAIRTETLRSIGGTDPSFGALIDAELHFRLQRAKIRIDLIESSEVTHAHPGSLVTTFSKNFLRGYWAAKLVQKHRRDACMNEQQRARLCMTACSYFDFFPAMIVLPFKKGLKRSLFNATVGIAWRMGIVAGIADCHLHFSHEQLRQ